MAKARYRAPLGDAKEVTAFGRTFKDGEWVEVPETIQTAAGKYGLLEKLRGNPHFQVQGEETYGDDMSPQARALTGVDAGAQERALEADLGERETDRSDGTKDETRTDDEPVRRGPGRPPKAHV